MFIFKIYTNEGLAFNFPQNQMTCYFVNRECEEFKSILRSPHANKNAQEQFYRIKYVYTIRFRARHKAEHFLKQLNESKAGVIKAFTLREKTRLVFTTPKV